MRTLVIGGTGPTGPPLLDALVERGDEVTILHRGVHEPDGLPDVEHIHADPHFADTVMEATEGRSFDLVIAMYGRVRALVEVFAHECQQFVATTGIVAYQNAIEPDRARPYGMQVLAQEHGPLADDAGSAPRFARLVLDAERSVLDASADDAFLGTIVRYPAIYGPRNPVPYEWSVIRRVLDGRGHMLVVDGGQEIITRCAARNAAHAIKLCTDHPDVAGGQVFNVADEVQFTTRQWIEVVGEALETDLEVVSVPWEVGEATYRELHPMPDQHSHLLVDTFKIRHLLGYRDVVTSLDAITDYVMWLVDNPPDLAEWPAFIDRFDYAAEDRLIAAYRNAIGEVIANARRPVPQREHAHAMPHPKVPKLTVDHGGR